MDYSPFVVDVPADFDTRFAGVFSPMRMPAGIDAPPKYGCAFPAGLLPKGMDEWLGFTSSYTGGGFRPLVKEVGGVWIAKATSKVQPTVLPLDGSGFDVLCWSILLRLCDDTCMPRDFALRGRPLQLLVQPFEFEGTWTSGIGLQLRAVRVMDLVEGWLRKELDRRRQEFDEYA